MVDANYQHTLAWFRALRRHEIVLPIWRIHRHIGMGGDQIVAALAGDDVEAELGDLLRAAEHEEFLRVRDECQPFDEAAGLLEDLDARGVTIVLHRARRGRAQTAEVLNHHADRGAARSVEVRAADQRVSANLR